ncbi:hypothetical protein Sjap_009507 [Stephania japonica]|uniref:Uncharacterized protein n=1 Tax=Stephania japonica TaxID=461633 RepID=A0AAP0JRG1_9MAGN
MENPIATPLPYPINMTFQSNLIVDDSASSSSSVGNGTRLASTCSHCFESGNPHSPGLPSYDLFENVSN